MKFYEYIERMKGVPYTEEVGYIKGWGSIFSRMYEWPMTVKNIGNSYEIIKIPKYYANDRYRLFIPVKGYSQTLFRDMYITTDIIADGLLYGTISSESFSGCVKLKRITIPKSITRIEENAFRGCDSLEDVYYEGTLEEWRKIDIVSEKYEVEFGEFYPGTPVQKIKCARLRHIPGNEALFRATIHFGCDLNELRPRWEGELLPKLMKGKMSVSMDELREAKIEYISDPNTSLEALSELAMDEDEDVRGAAKEAIMRKKHDGTKREHDLV